MMNNFIRFLIVSLFVLQAPVFCRADNPDKVKDIQDDIRIINLLNNMSLRKEQVEFILSRAKEASQINNAAQSKISLLKSDLVDVSEAIKAEVESGRVAVDKVNKGKFHKIKEETEGINCQTSNKIDQLAREIEGALEEFQLLALDTYKPCIIPIIQNGRIGQSDQPLGITRILERVKRVDSVQYERIRYQLADKILEKVKTAAVANSEIKPEEIKTKILAVFEIVRKMDSIEFFLQKESLARELHDDIYLPQPAPSRKNKIIKFFLNEKIIPILEKRI